MKYRVYIGWDPRDELAYRACEESLLTLSTVDLEIIPIKDHELRRKGVYWREYVVEPNGQRIDQRDGKPFSTEFSFARFAIPLIDDTAGPVLFCDADMLWRDDVAKLFALYDPKYAVQCVQHDYQPKEGKKFDGMLQERYFRKNWSSVMLLNPSMCKLTRYQLNNFEGSFLHALLWQPDDEIGALPPEWNVLDGWNECENPSVYHYTRGTPDMLGNDLPFANEWWNAVNRWLPQPIA